MKFKPILIFLLAIPLIASTSGCEGPASANEGSDLPYNGNVSMQMHLHGNVSGYFWHYTGYVELTFDPATPAGMVVLCVVDSGAIQGSLNVGNCTWARIPISGDDTDNIFKRPGHLDVFDKATMIRIAEFDFNWK